MLVVAGVIVALKTIRGRGIPLADDPAPSTLFAPADSYSRRAKLHDVGRAGPASVAAPDQPPAAGTGAAAIRRRGGSNPRFAAAGGEGDQETPSVRSGDSWPVCWARWLSMSGGVARDPLNLIR